MCNLSLSMYELYILVIIHVFVLINMGQCLLCYPIKTQIISHFRSKSLFFHGQIFRQKTFSSTNRFRACAVHHTEAELSWLTWIRVALTQIACDHLSTEIFRVNHFSVFLAVLDEFLPPISYAVFWQTSRKFWKLL
jgi:hypothetical protein